jgi:hypothetical protein
MRTSYSLFIILLFIFNSLMVYCQNGSVIYPHSKITLLTGEVIRARDITLSNDNVSFALNDAATGKKMNVIYELNKIKKVEVATKNNIIPGLIIGTGVGIISMLIAKHIIEKPKTETTSGYGYYQTTTTTKTMTAPQMLLVVGGGALLGTIIGVSIKRGWKTVFPKSTSMLDKFDFNLSLNPKYRNTSGVNLCYKF